MCYKELLILYKWHMKPNTVDTLKLVELRNNDLEIKEESELFLLRNENINFVIGGRVFIISIIFKLRLVSCFILVVEIANYVSLSQTRSFTKLRFNKYRT